MHYLLFYEVGDDYATRRAPHREEHLRKAWAASERGELILGGAFASPMDGAVLLFRGDSPEVAEQFARTDPYVTSGAVRRWHVREWTTVVGRGAAAPVRPGISAPAKPMVRVWKAHSTIEKAPLYVEHATHRVFPALQEIEGHRGAMLLRRVSGDSVEILVLTFWDSMSAIGSFAGPELDKAVVEPEAVAGLVTFDDFVTHFEIVQSTFGWT